jgi:hypothetical protein
MKPYLKAQWNDEPIPELEETSRGHVHD